MEKIANEGMCYLCKEREGHIRNCTKKRRDGSSTVYLSCRECNNSIARAYYKNNKEKCRAILYKSMKKHREKQNCRCLSHYYLKKGDLQKPKECECCGKKGKIEMHHEDYTKPLEVQWLCTGCHSEADRTLRNKKVRV